MRTKKKRLKKEGKPTSVPEDDKEMVKLLFTGKVTLLWLPNENHFHRLFLLTERITSFLYVIFCVDNKLLENL